MKNVLSGMLFVGFFVSVSIASDRQLRSMGPVGEDDSQLRSLAQPQSPRRLDRSVSACYADAESDGEDAASVSSRGTKKAAEDKEDASSSDTEKLSDDEAQREPVLKPRLVRRERVIFSRPLSPNSMRSSVQEFAARFDAAKGSDEKQAIAEDVKGAAQQGLVNLLARLVVSTDGQRFLPIQEEVAARVLAGTCDWDYMQAMSNKLDLIARNAHEAALEESSSASAPLNLSSEVPALLEQLRALQGNATELQLREIKLFVGALIEKNGHLLKGEKHARLLAVLSADNSDVEFTAAYCEEFIAALISACEVIQAGPVVEPSDAPAVADLPKKPTKKARGYCNAGRVLITGLVVAAVGVFTRVLMERGMLPF